MRTLCTLPVVASLVACELVQPTPDLTDAQLETIPYVEPEPLGVCETSLDCRSDEFCDVGDCIPASARSFRLVFLEGHVGEVTPTGGAWETSSWNTTTKPDLKITASWVVTPYEDEHGDIENRQTCSTGEWSDTYSAYWDDMCYATPIPLEQSFGLGPMGYPGGAIEIKLWDVDTFDADLGTSWVFSGAEALDELASFDGEILRLETPAEGSGQPIWVDVAVDLVVRQ